MVTGVFMLESIFIAVGVVISTVSKDSCPLRV